MRTSEWGNDGLAFMRLARTKEVLWVCIMLVLLCGFSWQAEAYTNASWSTSNSNTSLYSASSDHKTVITDLYASSAGSSEHQHQKVAYTSYKDDESYTGDHRSRERYRSDHQRSRDNQRGYYGNMEQYDLFKEGLIYAFQNIDIVLFFVALGYCWLFMSTGSIVMGAVLFGIGVYLGNRYFDTSLVHDPDILKAILLFSAGLIMLTSNELNEKLIPLMSVPIGIVCSLTFRINGPAEFLGKDFVIGAIAGILIIVLIANAIWSYFKDSWYINVGRKTLGAFLLVAGVIVMGVGSNPPPV